MAARRTWRSPVSLRDVFALGGLGMIFYGLWLIHRPTAFVATGGLLLALSLAAYLRRSG